jgi:hypothetical protein
MLSNSVTKVGYFAPNRFVDLCEILFQNFYPHAATVLRGTGTTGSTGTTVHCVVSQP